MTTKDLTYINPLSSNNTKKSHWILIETTKAPTHYSENCLIKGNIYPALAQRTIF